MGLFDFILKPIQAIFGEVLGFLTGTDFDEQDQASGVLVNKQSNIDPIPVIYGRRKVGGTRVFISTGGNKNEYLYMVVALSEGYIDAVEEIYINDELSVKNNAVVSGSKYQGLITHGIALGTDDQTYISFLSGADATWGSNHRLRGVAYVALRLKWDQDKFSGIPDVKCLVRGKRLYDPRKDSTSSVYDASLGVSTHREGNVGTHEFSTNPALCLRDYLRNERYGKGLPASLIDDQSFADAADFLDTTETSHTEAITVNGAFASGSTVIAVGGGFTWLPAGSFLQFSGDSNLYEILVAQYGAGSVEIEAIANALINGQSVTLKQKVYECNAVIDTGKKLFDNVKEMLQGMRGLMPFSNGVYSLVIDKDESSSFDLTPDNITSEITVQTQGKNKKYNRVTVKFANPDANWQSDSVTYPESGSADETTFLAEDNGEVLAKTIAFNTIANKYSAKDIAKIVCLASRKHEFACKVRATSEALEIAVADIVTLEHPSFGWTGAAKKKFRVIAMQLMDAGEVDLTLQEYDNSIYPWVSADEIDSGVDTTLPDPFTVAQPTGVSVTETTVLQDDGAVLPALNVTWTAADDSLVDEYEVLSDNTSKNRSQNFTTSETEFLVVPVIIGDSYTIKVRSINSLGVRSDYVTFIFGTVDGDDVAPSLPTGLGVSSGAKSITLTWTNPTEVDFKHCQVFVNTSNSIPANPTALVDAETFTIDGLTNGDTRYFWLKSVDFSDNVSSETSSIQGAVGGISNADIDVATILNDRFNDAIVTSQFYNIKTFQPSVADRTYPLAGDTINDSSGVLLFKPGSTLTLPGPADVSRGVKCQYMLHIQWQAIDNSDWREDDSTDPVEIEIRLSTGATFATRTLINSDLYVHELNDSSALPFTHTATLSGQLTTASTSNQFFYAELYGRNFEFAITSDKLIILEGQWGLAGLR